MATVCIPAEYAICTWCIGIGCVTCVQCVHIYKPIFVKLVVTGSDVALICLLLFLFDIFFL